jgi:3-deoxy-D-manno-octulosonate 8-phosphate phosphatase (KDO 8-P phosphatase)
MAQFNLFDRVKRIKLLIFDVDGVLTDGSMTYLTGDGISRRFDVKDGLGMIVLAQYGIRFAVITGKKNEMIERRAHVLGIADVLQSFPVKLPAYEMLNKNINYQMKNCLYW